MGPTGITAGDGVRAPGVDGDMGRDRAGRLMGSGEVLGSGLVQGRVLDPGLDMGMEVVVHMVVGMGLEVGRGILAGVEAVAVAVEEVAEVLGTATVRRWKLETGTNMVRLGCFSWWWM